MYSRSQYTQFVLWTTTFEHKHFAISFPTPSSLSLSLYCNWAFATKFPFIVEEPNTVSLYFPFVFCLAPLFFCSFVRWPRALFSGIHKTFDSLYFTCIAIHFPSPCVQWTPLTLLVPSPDPEFLPLLRFCMWHFWHVMISSGMRKAGENFCRLTKLLKLKWKQTTRHPCRPTHLIQPV